MTGLGWALPEGFADVEVCHDSANTQVSRVRLPDGSGTVVRKEFLGPAAATRWRREATVLDRLSGVAGVVQLLDRDEAARTLWFRDAGSSLRAMAVPRDPVWLVRLAGRLAEILEGVHQAGVVHKDLNPGNLVLAPDPAGARAPVPTLIDFDLATTFAEERPGFRHHSEVAGTLDYLAPEQTGRTGRAVDHRADLYALGATLYELATGRPPFGNGDGDPLDLLHAHLAVLPVPPVELVPELPPVLSRIIVQLLEKEPDRRYQSAQGLRHDLAQLEAALAAGGSGAEFPLGRRDFPSRFAAPCRLVGRDGELAVLHDTYRQVREGGVRGLFLAGAPGVGKTSLLDELRPLVTAGDGWFVTGKFDQYRRDTDALTQALRALGRLLLAEPRTELERSREQLLTALGPDAGLISGMPEFAALLRVPATEPSGEAGEGSARLYRAVREVLRCSASPRRPVALVLDDLQWASSFAVAGIDAVLTDPDLSGVLLVGAYRDTEVDVAHPLTGALARWERLQVAPAPLRLENLPSDCLATMLADLLRMEPGPAAALAAAIGALTAGNPYDTLELVNALRRDGSLTLRADGWHWNEAGVRRVGVGCEVVGLLQSRMAQLPADAAYLLRVAAALGNEVDLDLLAYATDTDVTALQPALAPALEDGLLIPVDDGADGAGLLTGIRFRHDRVQQAAFSAAAAQERAALHLQLGRRLAGHPNHQGLAAEQYLHVHHTLTEATERVEVARLFLATAERVRLTNPDNADRLLRAGIALVGPEDPESAELVPGLRVAHHATLSALGRLEEADQVYELIRAATTDPVALAASAHVQMDNLVTRGRPAEALQLGLDLLARLGLAVPDRDAMRAATRDGWPDLRRWATGDLTEDLRDNLTEDVRDNLREDLRDDEAEDPHRLAVTAILRHTCMVGYWTDKDVMNWLVVEAQRFWNRQGPSPELASALAFAGFAAGALGEDYPTGYAVLRRTLAVAEARGYGLAAPQIRFFFALTSAHWFEPLDEVLQHARQAREGLLRGGDLFHASFTANATMPVLLDTAPTLTDLETEIQAERAIAERTGNGQAGGLLGIMTQFVRAMRAATSGPGSFTDETFDETQRLAALATNPPGRATFHLARGLAAMIFGDEAALAEHARQATELAAAVAGTYRTTLARILAAVSLADRIRADRIRADRTRADQTRPSADSPAELLAEFDLHRSWLAARAADAPLNFVHLLAWVDAERAWAVDNRWVALAAFETALHAVDARIRPWQLALINERAGRFHLACGLEHSGQPLLRQAHDAYAAWGADGKVGQLRREFPFLRAARSLTDQAGTPAGGLLASGTSRGRSITLSADVVDLLAVVKASQALSVETNLDRLRQRVVGVLTTMTGATGVQLVLRNDESSAWSLPDPDDPGPGAVISLEDPGAARLLPLSAFRYAERTREPLNVPDAARDERFSRDPYLAGLDTCALLVVPVLSHGCLHAMLVLENRVQRAAFSPDRLDAVILIAGQLAVSLDNALAERFRSLVRRSGDLTVVCDPQGLISYASSAARDVLGVADDDLVGRVLPELAHPEDVTALTERLANSGADEGHLQCRLLHADGTPRWVEASLTDLTADPAVGGIMVRLRDITERHRLESELRHAQKLESIGQLSAGIAHEINTPIQFISDNLRFLAEAFEDVSRLLQPAAALPGGTPPDTAAAAGDVDLEYLLSEVPTAIAQTLDGAERVATIVRAMKAFGHPGRDAKAANDLNQAVRDTVVVATSEIRHVADVRLDLDEELPPVWCNIADINQVVLNLVVNAAHAMKPQAEAGHRGTLTIRTRTDGEDVLLEVEDTGTGIPAEIADRVFDQFFTTKPVGHGTGQGLALAHTLIHDHHGGTITFASTPGTGTTFTVRLPNQGH